MNVVKAKKRGDGKWLCLTTVPARQGYGYYACGNTACDDPDAYGNPTKCAVHSNAGRLRAAVRKEKTNKKWQDEYARKDAIRAAEAKILPALRRIADGHNDPMALAKEVLSDLDAAKAMP